jgi:hypothetical protein
LSEVTSSVAPAPSSSTTYAPQPTPSNGNRQNGEQPSSRLKPNGANKAPELSPTEKVGPVDEELEGQNPPRRDET